MGHNRFLSFIAPGLLLLALVGLQFINIPTAKSTYKVAVETQANNSMFPSGWTEAPGYGRAASLSPAYVKASLNQVAESVRKYPEKLIARNLNRVYVLDELDFYGGTCAASNSPDTVYLKHPKYKTGSCQRLDFHFHTRFSRILKNNYENLFDEQKWMACNPENFSYNTKEMYKSKAGDADLYTADFENGFLCRFAQTDLTADFSVTAAHLFSGNDKIWQLAEKYPRIKQKCDLTIEFFHKLDPSLDKDHFLNLSKKRKKPCC